jgi:hypothetical protein
MKHLPPWLLAILFAICYTQPIELYSNQHQYLLHAASQAGIGNLSTDWLANTTDPTPLFTFFVANCWKYVGLWPLQVLHFGLIAFYFRMIWSILDSLALLPTTWRGQFVYAALFTASHAGIFRYASDRLFGADYAWFLQCGVANQYLLGPGLQPSVIGVLLFAALAAYCAGRPYLAVGIAAGLNVVHATYLLPSAMLVAGILFQELRDGQTRQRLLLAGFALSIALPIVGFYEWKFQPQLGPKETHMAQDILAYTRIPHHTLPSRWFDIAAMGQVVLMVLGSWFLVLTRLFRVYCVMATLAALGTFVAIVVVNPTVSLTFPWRISAVLVPLATALGCAFLARKLVKFPRLMAGLGTGLLVTSLVGAVVIHTWRLGYQEPASEEAVLDYVRANGQPGELYLIPARFPKPNPPRGVYSNTFAPPPGPNVTVYFELARFRLVTGQAIFVDFKAIPYRDDEVLEWHRRVSLCVEWFGQPTWDAKTLDAIRVEGITHIVAPTALKLTSPGLALQHDAGAYQVFRVMP